MLINDGLKQLGLNQDDQKIRVLDRYVKEIELWNPRYGLVNAKGDQLIIRHILDSLSGVSLLKDLKPSSVADIGSGAGLPGIPLAIFLPDVQFSLVERSGRRVSFLQNAVLALGLKNVTIVEKAMEDLKNQYDVITFRGFSPFSRDLLGHLGRILAENGCVVAYKGKKRQINEELNQLDESENRKIKIIPVSVPFLKEERHMVTMSL
ncbi:MAG: 16S rRNA (guanine(527)-N(7))-methyltransferase RsmG [Spirochaetaceae bacterium 4572_59]|nr:MAG: 16S rRNA (guanine(527)-N(7))-methyltransferase RsmG [Spirochaetaceae bacterium 4572_59]